MQGVPVTYDFEPPLKDQLCLIGQTASPFQASWAFLQLWASAPAQAYLDIEACLFFQGHDRLAERDECWTFDPKLRPFGACELMHSEPPIHFTADASAVVGDFIEAQSKLRKGPVRLGRECASDTLLLAGDYVGSVPLDEKAHSGLAPFLALFSGRGRSLKSLVNQAPLSLRSLTCWGL